MVLVLPCVTMYCRVCTGSMCCKNLFLFGLEEFWAFPDVPVLAPNRLIKNKISNMVDSRDANFFKNAAFFIGRITRNFCYVSTSHYIFRDRSWISDNFPTRSSVHLYVYARPIHFTGSHAHQLQKGLAVQPFVVIHQIVC